MKEDDDYVSGPQHYWFQFVGGLIFGAGIGYYFSRRLFDSTSVRLFFTAVSALSLAFYCGRRADHAWRTISDWLQTWFNWWRAP